MAEYITKEQVINWYRPYGQTDETIPFETLVSDLRDMKTADVAPVRHGRWEDGRCSNCKEEAVSTSFDEPIYDYDWEENLRYSHTETHTEYHLTNYCPNCGAIMDLEGLTDG